VRARMSATQLPWRVRDRRTGIVMLLCPPGEFLMGSPASEAGRGADEFQHPVAIASPYYLSETAVTQSQWKQTMRGNPSRYKSNAENPVERVSWHDCQRFCHTAGLRLPSESEWEYACRAGTVTPFAFGPTVTVQQVNYDGNFPYERAPKGQYRDSVVPCGSLPANPWGFHEMHGNVWEWCEDSYEPRASGSQQASAGSDMERVLRGGAWNRGAVACRSACRSHGRSEESLSRWGFRVARMPS